MPIARAHDDLQVNSKLSSISERQLTPFHQFCGQALTSFLSPQASNVSRKFGLFCNLVRNLSHQLSNALMGTFPVLSIKLPK